MNKLPTALQKIRNERTYILGAIVVCAGLAYLFLVTFIKPVNENITYLIVGNVTGIVSTVLAFYFGSGEKKEENENKKEDENINIKKG